ncbi:hypothetical protein FGO68_gene9547 [Halteria grandinella]|uniref:VASt domain-containing protein n=1 Tax=Halteria grandinella TaxID=5974 RepID=A0A8J8NG59_HALGN|nr:hypothetical protein FGO68_gene9547 [Halteria grandinella]
MYLTENYICFYSSVLGISKKLIIPLNDVVKITKAKRLGIMKSLMIYHSTQKTPYKFQSFHDVDQTFKIVQRLWSNVSPYAADTNNAISSEEDNEADKNADDIDTRPSIARGSERATEIASSTGQNLGIVEERKELVPPGDGGDQRETVSNAIEEIKKQEPQPQNASGEPLDISLQIKNENSSLSLPAERAQGLTEIINSQSQRQAAPKQDKDEYITKEELEKLFEAYPLPGEGYDQCEIVLFNFPAKDFFKQMMDTSSPNAYGKFLVEKGEQNVTITDWAIPEPAEEYEGQQIILKNLMKADIQVKNNPFVKVSPTTKTGMLLENTDTKVVVKSMAFVTGVPLCDCFTVEEELLILAPSATAQCCAMRTVNHIIWKKSTMFRGKIISSTQKAGKENWQEYQEWVKKRGLAFKEKKPPQQPVGGAGKLKHGIEKSNKLFEKAPAESVAAPQQEVKLTAQQKALEFGRLGLQIAQNNRTETMLFIILIVMFRMYLQLCSIQNQLASLQQHHQ